MQHVGRTVTTVATNCKYLQVLTEHAAGTGMMKSCCARLCTAGLDHLYLHTKRKTFTCNHLETIRSSTLPQVDEVVIPATRMEPRRLRQLRYSVVDVKVDVRDDEGTKCQRHVGRRHEGDAGHLHEALAVGWEATVCHS